MHVAAVSGCKTNCVNAASLCCQEGGAGAKNLVDETKDGRSINSPCQVLYSKQRQMLSDAFVEKYTKLESSADMPVCVRKKKKERKKNKK
jgi:hypothetical protein